MAENGNSMVGKLVAMLPRSMTKKSAQRIQSAKERERRAIEAQTEGEASDSRNGVDQGEAGKKWDEEFPK